MMKVVISYQMDTYRRYGIFDGTTIWISGDPCLPEEVISQGGVVSTPDRVIAGKIRRAGYPLTSVIYRPEYAMPTR